MPRYKTKHMAEYVALRCSAGLFQVLPRPVALGFGWVLAAIAYHLFRFRRTEALRRIKEVFPTINSAEAEHIAWISIRNLTFNAIEMMRSRSLTPVKIRKLFPGLAPMLNETIHRQIDTGKGAILAVPHMGNWELAGLAAHHLGLPIFNIAAKQRNPLVNDYLTRLRQGPGILTLERGDGTLRSVLKFLREGKVLAILPDVRMRTPDLKIPFLGGSANLGRGMALFAKHADIPIYPCIVRRKGWLNLTADIHRPILPDPALSREEDSKRITQVIMRRVEEEIRKTPEQWFWYNKRWVLEPVSATG